MLRSLFAIGYDNWLSESRRIVWTEAFTSLVFFLLQFGSLPIFSFHVTKFIVLVYRCLTISWCQNDFFYNRLFLFVFDPYFKHDNGWSKSYSRLFFLHVVLNPFLPHVLFNTSLLISVSVQTSFCRSFPSTIFVTFNGFSRFFTMTVYDRI